jgi:hypothetical protein
MMSKQGSPEFARIGNAVVRVESIFGLQKWNSQDPTSYDYCNQVCIYMVAGHSITIQAKPDEIRELEALVLS